MKKHTQFLTIILIGIFFSSLGLAQGDKPEGSSFQIDIPQHIQLLNQQIKLAEDNENWDQYYSLRQQIIDAWKQVNPEVANMYRTTNSLEQDALDQNAPKTEEITVGADSPLWGDDLLVHAGSATDISLAVSRGDTLILAALDNSSGYVAIYRSGNGGISWSPYTNISVSPSNKIEILEFDGYPGNLGPSYILLFTLYDSGTLYCTRFETPSIYVNSVVATGCTDFAVDRNFSSTNYRCFVQYDSAATQVHKRSDPASYATIWQDPISIPGCEDPSIAYGYNGSVFLSYNGRSSGNLYILSNNSYMDPLTVGVQSTVEDGSTDTTFSSAIIASRQDTSTQTVIAVYNWLNNGRMDLRTTRKVGGAGWSLPANWSSYSDTDNKNVALYCAKTADNDIFQSVFTRTGLGNLTPRAIRYRKYSSGVWSGSIEVSGPNPTGLQNASVVEMNTGLAAYAYAGVNSLNVYFDKEDWITDVTAEAGVPDVYSLSQNYPNPFNPSTAIRFNIPQQDHVVLKIFNNIGQEVSTLVNQDMDAGSYEVNFNASDLASGVYFYRIQTANYSESKKMILIK